MTNKKLWSTMLSLVATIIVLFALGGITVFADETDESQPEIIASGYCGAEGNGENISWTLDGTGLLTISGTGEMRNNYYVGTAPWYNNVDLIKAVNIDEGVTSIGDISFFNCESLASIDIPDSVTSIGNYAFYDCTSLTSITIPNSVTSIGYSAFYNCSSLTTITIPNSVTSIGDNAFAYCTKLASVTIPDSITGISDSAFAHCTKLVSVTIPDSITGISDYAFAYCTKLVSVTIPDSVTSIGDSAFKYCESLTTITIPDSVTSIGDNAFAYCTKLASVTIPDSVTSISEYAFYECTSLASIDIPDSVTSIGDYAFACCTKLALVTIPDSVTRIGDYAFAYCAKLASVTIHDSVTTVGDGAFYFCTSLTSVTIPNSVTSIGNHAFYNCTSLTSITIPNSVTTIGDRAFISCNNITKLILNANPNVFVADPGSIFPSTMKANVHVPGEYYSTYESLFSGFVNVIVCDLFGTEVDIGSGVHLVGYSLRLDGCIGVNFYMKLSDTVLDNANTAYMEFTVNTKTQQVPVSDASSKDGYLVFRCDVVAKEMADEITAQVYLSEGNPIGDSYTYSVQEYAAYIIDHPEKYSPKAIELVKAMLNYGAASQKYFNHNTDYLANSILPLGEQQSALPLDEQQSALSSGNLTYYNAGDISPEKISLSLKSTITMKLYFKTEDISDITSFEYRKNQLTTTVSGDYTIVIIEGIPATNFSGIISIKCYLNEGDEYKTVKIKPSNYAYIALKQPVGGVITDDLKGVVRALYLFSLAANEYNLVQPA